MGDWYLNRDDYLYRAAYTLAEQLLDEKERAREAWAALRKEPGKRKNGCSYWERELAIELHAIWLCTFNGENEEELKELTADLYEDLPEAVIKRIEAANDSLFGRNDDH